MQKQDHQPSESSPPTPPCQGGGRGGCRYTLVLPARNEEERISETLITYFDYFDKHCDDSYEVIVVANACSDRTLEVTREFTKSHPHLRVIDLPQPGKGRAILKGFEEAKGEIVLFCDSDGSTEPGDVLKLLKLVGQGECDCAIGSRWLPDSIIPIPQPLKRRIASRIFNLAVRLIFSFRYQDTQCGAKAFNRQASSVVQKGVTSYGYHFDCDALWQLKRAGIKVLEVPITWRDQGGSGIQVGRDGFKMLSGLLKIRFFPSSRGS